MHFTGFDPLYLILMIPVIALSLFAQFSVKSNFNKFMQYTTKAGYTGAQIAKKILEKNGITDIKIEQTSGWLSDHYAPTQKTLRLSSGVFESKSISAIGVAAHEVGHALQHYQGMLVMRMWMAMARPAAISSNLAIFLILIGSFISMFKFLAIFGLILFLGVVIFQIITLPLEFNASNRAKKLLAEYGLVTADELKGVSAVLNSAAMTYVAAAAAALVQLLYFAIRLGLLGGRRD